MNKRLAIWATAMLMAGATAQGATFPVITAFTNAASYTNRSGGLQTIVRVTVATPLVVSNQVFMRYTQGLATNLGFTSTATTNFRSALWPGATSDIAVVLYNNDRILISQTYTGNTYATFDVLQSSGGGGSGSGSLEEIVSGGNTNSGVTHLILEGDSVGSHSVAGNTSTIQLRSNPTNITTGAITTDTVRANSMVSAGAIQVGAEIPFSSFGELKTHLGLRDYVSAVTYPNTLGGTPYTDGAIITMSEGASAAGGTTITLGRNILVGQGGITVTNSLLYGNVIIISGNLTNSLELMFPPQTNTVSRFYYRPAVSAPPYDMGYVDIPATTSGYLRIVGSTNSALLLAVDEIASIATASNATLFAGNGAAYYRNFGNITNVQVWDDALQTLTETTFFGFEAGDGANFTWVNRTNATGTNRILRIDVASGSLTGACTTCSNEWTEANIYSGGAILEYRGIQMKVSGNGNSNTGATFASVSPMGTGNVARGNFSTIAGGRGNTASGVNSTIAGGYGNSATGDQATVVGGYGNTARGANSVVMGGYLNQANGVGSIAAGYQNEADASYASVNGYRTTASAGADYSFLHGLFATTTNAWTFGILEGTSTNIAEILRSYTAAFYTTTTNKWRLGIGTNSPIAGLDVHGGFNFTGPITSNGVPFSFTADTTNAVTEVVTSGDSRTSTPRRVVFAAGSGSSPTSTVNGTTTTVHVAGGGGGGDASGWSGYPATQTVNHAGFALKSAAGYGTVDFQSQSYGASAAGNFAGLSTFDTNSYGATMAGYFAKTNSIGRDAFGAIQRGYFDALQNIGQASYGAGQAGLFSDGNQSIGEYAYGAHQIGGMSGTESIGSSAYGAHQIGWMSGSESIGSSAYGAHQIGWMSGSESIGPGAYGAHQVGTFAGTESIGSSASGAHQIGGMSGTETIGAYAHGAHQIGLSDVGASATNNAAGAMQLLYLSYGEHALTTSSGGGSMLTGPGTSSNKWAITAASVSHGDGSISARAGLWSGDTNISELVGSVQSYAVELAGRTSYTGTFFGTLIGDGVGVTNVGYGLTGNGADIPLEIVGNTTYTGTLVGTVQGTLYGDVIGGSVTNVNVLNATGLVRLAGADVRISPPNYGDNPATKDYVDSGSTAYVTNAINRLVYPDATTNGGITILGFTDPNFTNMSIVSGKATVQMKPINVDANSVNDFRSSTQGYMRVATSDSAAGYPRLIGGEVVLSNASPNGSTLGYKLSASAGTTPGNTVRDVGGLYASQRVGTGQLLSLSTAGGQNADNSIIVSSNLVSQTHEHISLLLGSGAGPSGLAFFSIGAVENAANNAIQTVYSMARFNFGSSTGGFSAATSFNDMVADRDFYVWGDTNLPFHITGSNGRVMIGAGPSSYDPKPQEALSVTNGNMRLDGNLIIGASGTIGTNWVTAETNKAIIMLVDEGATNKAAWISDPDSGSWTKLTSHNPDGDFVLTDIDDDGISREYNITKLFAAIEQAGNVAQVKQAFKDHSKTKRIGPTKAEKKAIHDAKVDAWQARKTAWQDARQAEIAALKAFRELPKNERRVIAAKGQRPPEPREPFAEEKP